jgi:hypothetical protein
MSPPYHPKESPSTTPGVSASDCVSLRQPPRAASERGVQAAAARDAASILANLQHILVVLDSAPEGRVRARQW